MSVSTRIEPGRYCAETKPGALYSTIELGLGMLFPYEQKKKKSKLEYQIRSAILLTAIHFNILLR